MSTDEYVPDDDQVENAYIEFESEPTSRLTDDNLLTREEAQARWSRWLAAHDARVRRDALDGLIAWHRKNAEDPETPMSIRRGIAVMADEAQRYRDTHYPETED